MTSIFSPDGKAGKQFVPLLKPGPCASLRVEHCIFSDGYNAHQLAFGDKKEKAHYCCRKKSLRKEPLLCPKKIGKNSAIYC